MDEVVRSTYRLRPGRTAETALLAEWGRCRWLWNEAVHQQKTGQKPTFARLGKLLTGARARLRWLREGSQVAQQQMLRNYAQALDHSFKVTKHGRPKVKSRKTSLPSLEYTTRGFSVRDGHLVLPKGVTVPVVWSRDLPSPPTSVRVYRDSLGYWYASFVVRREVESYPRGRGGIGIDWGVSTTAATTDPYTTMTCSRCFARTKQLELHERDFRCIDCGHADSRDRNAARVILAVAERGHVSVDDVRQSDHLLRAGGSVAVRAGNLPSFRRENR